MKSLLAVFLAGSLLAQTPQQMIPASAIYQMALEQGITYVAPSSSQAVLSQKTFFSKGNMIGLLLGTASVTAMTIGIQGLFAIPKAALVGLGLEHIVYDQYGQPIVSALENNGLANLPPLLQVNSYMVPGGENTIFASSVPVQALTASNVGSRQRVTLKQLKRGAMAQTISGTYLGYQITFSPQVGNGINSKNFIPVDVLVGVTPVASASKASVQDDKALEDRILKVMSAHKMPEPEIGKWELQGSAWTDLVKVHTVDPDDAEIDQLQKDLININTRLQQLQERKAKSKDPY